MNSRFRRQAWLWTSAAAVLLSAALSWEIARYRRAQAARLNTLEAALESNTRELKQAADRLASAELQLAQLSPLPAKPKAGGAKDTAASRKKAPPNASPQRNLALVAKDPKMRASSVQVRVDECWVKFAGLFAKLGLTADQVQAFTRAEGAFQEGILDLAAASADQGIDWSDPSLARMRAELDGTLNDQLKALFGANFDQWTEVNLTANSRAIVNQVLQKTYDGPGALSGAQADQLTAILANNNAKYQPGLHPADPASYHWDAVLSQASAILSQPQLAAFEAATELVRLKQNNSVSVGVISAHSPE